MDNNKININKNYKYKNLKVYGSSEWLANGKRKYRRVFDKAETTYIYAELSFHNKLFDQHDWEVDITLKAFAINEKDKSRRRELCSLDIKKMVTKDQAIVYVYQAWGNKRLGFYWKKGEYEWVAYINGKKVDVVKFWIEEVGLVNYEHNPYFNIEHLKLYEGPNSNVNIDERTYYKVFDHQNTKYVFIEFVFQNLVKTDWHCELIFKFYNSAHHLKGETVEILNIDSNEEKFIVTSGWGSNDPGTWYQDNYTLEIIFMDTLIAALPFQVSKVFEEGINEATLPGVGGTLLQTVEEEPKSLTEVMADLDELIGLSTIKTRIKDYAEYLKFIKLRLEKGFEDAHNINLHAVFTGNPGTGKTTVAQMLGKIYKHLGLLTKGHVHAADRADLVGEYIGQTAPKVKEAIKQARGGILFIDEAYSLARAKEDSKDFGREVIEILIKEMSDGEGNLAIIVAGYPNEMRAFIDTNPGLRSRFTQWFNFPDYTPKELTAIASVAAKKRNIIFTQQAKVLLGDKIVEAYRNRDRFFGNARFVYSLIDQAKINLGLRVMKNENPRALDKEKLSTIEVVDIEPLFLTKEKKRPAIPIDEILLKKAIKELNQLIGLKSVKKEINELVQLVRFYKEQNKGVLHKFSLHTIFSGNPGTGKTTVARILAKIYKALGILERGHLVEVDRQKLVAGYVGQTAIKTTEQIDNAIGGVLFIDEAYALTQRPGGADYGSEAIETIIKRMEDQKGEFAVVVAGYPKEMRLFLDTNPGLSSRFDRSLTFSDYTVSELMEIASSILKKEHYQLTNEAKKLLNNYFAALFETKNYDTFGNARTVIKTIQEIIKIQNLRLAKIKQEDRSAKMLSTINVADMKAFSSKVVLMGGRKRPGFARKQPGGAS